MSMAKIIDGKKIAKDLELELKQKVMLRVDQGFRAPCLAVVIVGADPASKIYVNKKRKTCESIGIKSLAYDLDESTTEDELLKLIDDLNNNHEVDGILVQLPLPKHIDKNKVIDAISPNKDVDGFNATNLGKLAIGNPGLRPCTPYGITKMLNQLNLKLRGMKAVVIGSSNIVGKPMAFELMNLGCTVTICNSATKDLPAELKEADIVVVAIGNPKFIKADYLKENVIAIDVGINRLEDGSICGDLDYAEVSKKASYITPVPGGVGPMTVACLMENTYLASIWLHS